MGSKHHWLVKAREFLKLCLGNLLTFTGRTQAGRDIAGNISSSTSALANLTNQQGAGLGDILGSGANNMASLMQGYGQMTAAQQQQLGSMLGNISTGQGSQLSNIAQGAGNAQSQAALAAGANQQQLIGNLAGAYGLYKGGQ